MPIVDFVQNYLGYDLKTDKARADELNQLTDMFG